jgi:hypothetical protein
VGATHIRLVVDLHHATGVNEARRQQPARAVVLEAAGEDPLAASGQRRDDGIPSVSGVLLAVPRERELSFAVDDLARSVVQAHGHDGLLCRLGRQ